MKSWFIHNVELKILSAILAFVIWLLIQAKIENTHSEGDSFLKSLRHSWKTTP